MNSNYSEKLKDPRWQKKRLEIFERDKWMCRNCFDENSTLNVHHLWYCGEPWESPDDSLITLCEECHENEKENRRKAEEEFLESLKKAAILVEELQTLTDAFNSCGTLDEINVYGLAWVLENRKILEEVTSRCMKGEKP